MAAHTGSTLAHLQNSEADELYPLARVAIMPMKSSSKFKPWRLVS